MDGRIKKIHDMIRNEEKTIDPEASVMMSLALIDQNRGQIPGVPDNPRCIAREDFGKLKARLAEDPEFTGCNEIIVTLHEGRYVAVSGNMRLEALRELGWEEVPVKVVPEGTPADAIARYVLLGNASFGKWGIDRLASGWESALLTDLGIEVPQYADLDPDELGEEFTLPDGEQSRERTVSFQLSATQEAVLRRALRLAEERGVTLTTHGNGNLEGNYLHAILTQWEGQRR